MIQAHRFCVHLVVKAGHLAPGLKYVFSVSEEERRSIFKDQSSKVEVSSGYHNSQHK